VQDLIEFIARSLVDDPMEVRVIQGQRGSNVEVRLQVSKEDMGRVLRPERRALQKGL